MLDPNALKSAASNISARPTMEANFNKNLTELLSSDNLMTEPEEKDNIFQVVAENDNYAKAIENGEEIQKLVLTSDNKQL